MKLDAALQVFDKLDPLTWAELDDAFRVIDAEQFAIKIRLDGRPAAHIFKRFVNRWIEAIRLVDEELRAEQKRQEMMKTRPGRSEGWCDTLICQLADTFQRHAHLEKKSDYLDRLQDFILCVFRANDIRIGYGIRKKNPTEEEEQKQQRRTLTRLIPKKLQTPL